MALTTEQLDRLRAAFRPHFPIEDPNAFFGRGGERTRVCEALAEPGLQIVVYGERGCGKTSLVNVATEGLELVKVFCESEADFPRIMRDIAWQVHRLDPQRRVYNAAQDTISFDGIVMPLAGITGNNLLSILPNHAPFCVVLDELDRVRDRHAIALLAELTKNVATNHRNLTFIMVGVATTADDLLEGHASNFRNLLQVQLDRMEEQELTAILTRGEQVLGITFHPDAAAQIIILCDRSPYYLHLLAKGAARAALNAGAPTIEMDDVMTGCREAAARADQQLRNAYHAASIPERGTRIYQRIIWAMANLIPRANNVADIRLEVNNIALGEGDAEVTPQAVSRALRLLASSQKGQIVYPPMGTPGVYCFSNPLMKGFVRLVRYGA